MKSFATRALLTALLAGAPPAAVMAQQADGPALMREANSLVRSGLYRAALLRYREAAAAGVDSPLLYYNLGIVYYRLERYAEAEQALARAVEDSRLAPLATYNRGLAQLALGDRAAAEASFLAVADSAAKRELRRLAERAAERAAGSAAGPSRAPERRRATRRDATEPRDLRVLAFARLAQDDNVYRAPSDAYVDQAAPGQPLVTPVAYSASYVPVDLIAEYRLPNEAGDTDFVFAYRMNGDFYDREFSNATSVSQELSIGADIVLGEHATPRRNRTLDSMFFVRSHEETNFDPDDGLDRAVNGEGVADRFRYRAAGIEVDYSHSIEKWEWGFDVDFEKRQYADIPLLTNYDHAYYSTRLWVEREINRRTSLSFGLRRFQRVYDERRARDLAGVLLSTNPALEYAYSGAQIGVRRRLGGAFELRLDYLRLDRVDGFVGYYDYTQDVVRIGAAYRPSARLEVGAWASSRVYDYPNAFAFNLPSAGARELDSVSAEVELEYSFNQRISLWASIETYRASSTDPRYAYDRSVSMLGVKWRRR